LAAGLRPDPLGEIIQRFPDPIAGLRGVEGGEKKRTGGGGTWKGGSRR